MLRAKRIFPVRLAELEPHWVSVGGGNRHGMGISFNCPHCDTVRLAVWFSNPIDGGAPYTRTNGGPVTLWNREGDTFDMLSVHPSVDASEHGHWHGYIACGLVS